MTEPSRPEPRERSDTFVQAGSAARRLYELGYNPLPSMPDRKAPALRRGWSRYRAERIPPKWFDKWWAPNIQVLTGTAWRLAVVDIDGWRGLDAWQAISAFRTPPRTWTVLSGGNDAEHFGMHLWFRLPGGLIELRSRRLWAEWDGTLNRGQGGFRGKPGVELLADCAQIIVPPSVHRRTGAEYRWSVGPDDLPEPAELPGWLAAYPGVKAPSREIVFRPRMHRKPSSRPVVALLDRVDVLDAVPDKIALARSWGVRIASQEPNPAGWVQCHAIGRPDRHPSAMLSEQTGCYWEPEMGRVPMSLFDLGAALGIGRNWREVVDQVGSELGISSRARAGVAHAHVRSQLTREDPP